MICGASIAKRDGTHRRCLLPPDHLGDCAPIVLVGASPWRPLARVERAIGAGVSWALVLLALLICCLSGCTPEQERAVGWAAVAGAWLGVAFCGVLVACVIWGFVQMLRDLFKDGGR